MSIIEGMSTDTEIITRKLFTVDEYHRMGDLGILPETGRFELIRGEIIEMPVPGSRHAGRVKRLNRLFTSRLGESVIVSIQDPVGIDLFSEPVPDAALLKPRADFYTESHPMPGDVLLIVEVSDSTAKYDSTVKASLYAEAGIPEYWILNVKQDVLVIHSEPADGTYRQVRVAHREDTVSLQKLPNISFPVEEILG